MLSLSSAVFETMAQETHAPSLCSLATGMVVLYVVYILVFVELKMWMSGIPPVPASLLERCMFVSQA